MAEAILIVTVAIVWVLFPTVAGWGVDVGRSKVRHERSGRPAVGRGPAGTMFDIGMIPGSGIPRRSVDQVDAFPFRPADGHPADAQSSARHTVAEVSANPDSDANAIAQPRTVAVIEVGTTSIRMAIAEVQATGSIRMLEALSQGVSLGKDSFTRGEIGKQTIEDCVRVLRAYRRKLEEYGVRQVDQLRVVATSAVREALNQMAFVDRIYIATGLTVQPIDEAEVHRITYRSIQPLLVAEPRFTDAHTIICEVGGGSTELLVVERGNVRYSHSYRLGIAAAAPVAAGSENITVQGPGNH